MTGVTSRINAISSQAWYFLFALLGVFIFMIPLFFHIKDPGTITAFIGQGGTLLGVAAGGLQSDAKKTTTTETAEGTTSKTTVTTPSAPPNDPEPEVTK